MTAVPARADVGVVELRYTAHVHVTKLIDQPAKVTVPKDPGDSATVPPLAGINLNVPVSLSLEIDVAAPAGT